jgi:hypothetical protein
MGGEPPSAQAPTGLAARAAEMPGDGVSGAYLSARAITTRWISLVPS